jgi:hypothetical protein
VAGAPFFERQHIPGRRHHLATNCGKLVTEAAMCSPLRVCEDPARKFSGLDNASTSPGKVGQCPMHCLLCTACPACDVVLLNALLCVHCMHTVLRCSADACLLVPIFANHDGGAARCHAVRVVRAGLPLRPQPGIRGGSGRDCKRAGGHGRRSSQEVEVCLVHVV